MSVKVILALVGAVFLAWGVVRGRRHFLKLQEDWGSFATTKGYSFAERAGSTWIGFLSKASPKITGSIADVPFELTLLGKHREGLQWTRVTALIAPAEAGTLGQVTWHSVPDAAMGPDARALSLRLRSRYRDAVVHLWSGMTPEHPRPGSYVSVTWRGVKYDPQAMEDAIDLAVLLVHEHRARHAVRASSPASAIGRGPS